MSNTQASLEMKYRIVARNADGKRPLKTRSYMGG